MTTPSLPAAEEPVPEKARRLMAEVASQQEAIRGSRSRPTAAVNERLRETMDQTVEFLTAHRGSLAGVIPRVDDLVKQLSDPFAHLKPEEDWVIKREMAAAARVQALRGYGIDIDLYL
jgi:uncharacterized membrane protein YccC